jgi:hypothetical protein
MSWISECVKNGKVQTMMRMFLDIVEVWVLRFQYFSTLGIYIVTVFMIWGCYHIRVLGINISPAPPEWCWN